MKRIPVSALLLLLTWWGIFFGLVFRKSGLPYRGDMLQASLFYIVKEHEEPALHKAIKATPVWNFRDPNPPMGARTAIEFAERFKMKHLRPINNASWKIKSLAAYAIEDADLKWCWAV